MNPITEIERKLLRLPPIERERIALKAWESLVEDEEAMSDPGLDEDGVNLAIERDVELEQGVTDPIDNNEFRRRTGGDT